MGTLVVAGFVQGMTGFGFGMVSMALLPLVIGIREAAAISTIYTLMMTVATFWRNRGHYDWRLGLPFFVSSCVGVPLGVYFLAKMQTNVLLRFLGAVMLIMAVSQLFFNGLIKPTRPALAMPFGLFSGGLSGAFNLGGVPTAAYAYANGWSRGQIVAFLQVVITSSCLLRILFYQRAGFYAEFSWQFALIIIVPLYLALSSGHYVMQRIHPKHMRQGIFGFIGLFGLYYLFLH